MPGKITSSLNAKLDSIEWGSFLIGDLFEKIELKYKRKVFDKNEAVSRTKSKEFNLPLVNAKDGNNGIMYYGRDKDFESIDMSIDIVNDGAVSTGNVYPQPQRTGILYNAYLIKPKFKATDKLLFFLSTVIKKSIKYKFGYENKASWEKVRKEAIKLPIFENKINLKFMESVITDIEIQKYKELKDYLLATGLFDCELTQEEENTINNYKLLTWQKFNLEALFGKSDRGRRLKSEDRISGTIPFVTAGESDEGISDFIGNEVQIFSENTTTIDMFGSAKYRNYEYGADDHVSIVHTENLNKFASIFVTSAIHKASHNGQFNYGKNFYPKDADELFIMLPELNGNPDFKTMEIIISAIHKIVIKDLVIYLNNKLAEKHYKINNPYLMVNN